MDDSPQRQLITSRAQLADALPGLLSLARHSVRCCAHDGAVFNLGTTAVVDLLGQLVLTHRDLAVRVLVDDPQWIETAAPRFKTLQRRFAHAVQLRAANPQDPVGADMQLLVDDRHGLLLRPTVLTSGELWLASPHRVQPLTVDFDRRWAAAAHDLPVAPLGL
jgi:hypothetical protein